MSQRLFVNVSGGSTLAIEMKRRLAQGDNKVPVSLLGSDTDFGSVDLVERGRTRFGSLDLVKVEMPRNSNGSISKTKSGANLIVRAREAGSAEFSVQAAVSVGVQIRHRLVIADDGQAEFSTKAILSNSGKTPIKDASLTITAGDNQNRGNFRNYARSAALESAGGPSVSAAGASVYRFDLKDPVSLARGETLPINLFNEDMVVKTVGKSLDLETSGNYYGKDSRSHSAGSVQTTYSVENDKANGMGFVLPAGSVEIKRPDGLLLSNTNIGDTSSGEALSLPGGRAFDIEATRKQTSYDAQDVGGGASSAPRGRRGEARTQNVTSGQEITLCSKSAREESINISESLPQSSDGSGAKVTNVKINGQAVPASGYSIDEENSALKISGVKVPSQGEAKITFDVAFTQEVYR
jgi:hypothetical protein